MLQSIQQLCGINTILYYSATIIRMAGVTNTSQAIWLTCVTGAFSFLANCASFPLVERMGRRLLTLVSLAAVIASLILVAICFTLADFKSVPITNATVYSGDHCKQYTRCMPCTNDPECGFCFQRIGDEIFGVCLPVNPEKHLEAKGKV